MDEATEKRIAHLEAKGIAHDAVVTILVDQLFRADRNRQIRLRKVAIDAVEAQYKTSLNPEAHLVLQTALQFVDDLFSPLSEKDGPQADRP
jgi:hypothetical protein